MTYNIAVLGERHSTATRTYRDAGYRIRDAVVRTFALPVAVHRDELTFHLLVLADDRADAVAVIEHALENGLDVLADRPPTADTEELMRLYALAHRRRRMLRIGVPRPDVTSVVRKLGVAESITVRRTVASAVGWPLPLLDTVGIDRLTLGLAVLGTPVMSGVVASSGRDDAKLVVRFSDGAQMTLMTRRGAKPKDETTVVLRDGGKAELRFWPPIVPGGDDSGQIQRFVRGGRVSRGTGTLRRVGGPLLFNGLGVNRGLALEAAVAAAGEASRLLPWPNDLLLLGIVAAARPQLSGPAAN